MKTNKKGVEMKKTKTKVTFFTTKGKYSVVTLKERPLLQAHNSFKNSRDINTNQLDFQDAKVEKVVVKKYPYTVTLNYTKFLNLLNN